MKFKVVIGANYGDEGKGMVCEALCRSSEKPVVVMTNGGCQRGHTVDMPENRHVFHHFGSGAMLGVPTYFPASYLMNPMKYVEEYSELERAGFRPVCVRSPGCTVQLPSDVLVNRVLESSRPERYGSVGWGIWEAVVRKSKGWGVSVGEFARLPLRSRKALCREMTARFVEERISGSGLKIDAGLYRRMRDLFDSDGFLEHFSQDFDFMYRSSTLTHMDDLLDGDFGTAVFENSQGLLLDCEYSGDPVHSTPSRTGMNGVVECLESEGLDCGVLSAASVDAYYVSRTYLTRHGAGPFREEVEDCTLPDATNAENEWQGRIRFGRFDGRSCRDLIGRIEADSKKVPSADVRLVITHCDEIPPPEYLAARSSRFVFGRYPDGGIF